MSNRIDIGSITSSNPHLWLDALTLSGDPVVYQIATLTPTCDENEWISVNQFCSVLSIAWLRDNPSSPFGLGSLGNGEKLAMAEVILGYQNMDDQVDYAVKRLHGQIRSLQQVIEGVEKGHYAAGTCIWTGNDFHVVAVRVADPKTIALYDPNSGEVQKHERSRFGILMGQLGNSTFVVADPC
ncbi:hypothetical protein SAMN05661010_01398 [Modicisalibacter muralis]|uniref:Peptidase C39-like domain-containing protein n=1 Tax=Modicisalibacter muralis TaxID=119000 RepID=A0A1G9IZS4_9GAMM|nr:hypothetical protein [Halomonas muralis]SDL30536.1 hypothetical protein SAMN05661010_01398 [Halomonas muralis]